MFHPHILRDDSLSIFIEGRPKTIDDTHPHFTQAVNAVREQRWDDVVRLIDLPAMVLKFSEGRVQVYDGEVHYDGEPVHTVVAARIIKMANEGFNVAPMCRFLDKVMQNPIQSAREELFLWLEQSDMPIHEDGDFLAYKWVRENYTDCHTGKFDNSVGMIVSMPREQVDPDRNRTCSAGLHFCSLKYLPHFAYGRGRCMILKINPADVVAIPYDYSNSKGRTWRYHVIAEYEEQNILTPAFERSVFDPDRLREELGVEEVFGRKYRIHVRGLDDEGVLFERTIDIPARNESEALEEVRYSDEMTAFENLIDDNEPKIFKVEPIDEPKWRVRMMGTNRHADEGECDMEMVTFLVYAATRDEAEKLARELFDEGDIDPFKRVDPDEVKILTVVQVIDEPEDEEEPENPCVEMAPSTITAKATTWWRRLIGG